MKSKEIFNLVLRLIGLAFLYHGLSEVPAAVFRFCPKFPYFNYGTLLPSVILVGWPLIMAWWLVRGAPLLMRLAYPERPVSEPLKDPASNL